MFLLLFVHLEGKTQLYKKNLCTSRFYMLCGGWKGRLERGEKLKGSSVTQLLAGDVSASQSRLSFSRSLCDCLCLLTTINTLSPLDISGVWLFLGVQSRVC